MALPTPIRETVEKEINQTTYKITKLGAKVGKRVLARLIRAAGPAFEAEQTFGALCAALTDAELDYFCDTFAEVTSFSPAAEPDKEWRLKDMFDTHFSGKYGEMTLWLKACLEVNYGNFLEELGIDPAVIEKMMAAAKDSMASTPKDPTARFGVSSTAGSGG